MLTCDRWYNIFDLKKKRKDLIKDLIIENFKTKKQKKTV